MQPSLKAALKYCAKIEQGVETSDEIIDIPLCDQPPSQKSKLKFFIP